MSNGVDIHDRKLTRSLLNTGTTRDMLCHNARELLATPENRAFRIVAGVALSHYFKPNRLLEKSFGISF